VLSEPAHELCVEHRISHSLSGKAINYTIGTSNNGDHSLSGKAIDYSVEKVNNGDHCFDDERRLFGLDV
jgi:hypothetical protein